MGPLNITFPLAAVMGGREIAQGEVIAVRTERLSLRKQTFATVDVSYGLWLTRARPFLPFLPPSLAQLCNILLRSGMVE